MTGPDNLVRQVKIYPMTYEQEAIWLDDHLDHRPSRYLESWVYRLSGSLDLDAMEWAIARMVDRHEALRSRLVWYEGQLAQIVAAEHGTRLRRAYCPAGAVDDELGRIVSLPLDPAESPLRPVILHLTPDEFVLAIQLHHAVIDDWALTVMGRELSELYAARVERRAACLRPLPVQLGEFAVAQRAAGVDQADLTYWRQRLRDMPAENSAPPDRPRPEVAGHRGGLTRFRVESGLASLVWRTARAERTTAFAVLAAGLTALICGYRRSSDLVIGTPVSLREDSSLDPMIACLTRLMPLRLTFRPGESFGGLLRVASTAVWEAIAHKNLPYTVLAARAAPRSRGRTAPLCQTVLVVNDRPATVLPLPEVRAERLYVRQGTSKFDLCLTLNADDDGYQGFLEYSSDLYNPQSAERIAQDFQAVLSTVMNDTRSPLSELLPWVPRHAICC